MASVSASAKGIANKALKKAKAAQSTANTALSNAAGAQSSANTAQSSANTALKEAKSAQTSAKAAQTTANEAKTAAANAQTTANSKFGRTEFVVGASSGPETTLGLSIAECGPVGGTITGGGYTAGGAGNNEVVPIYTGAYGNAWLADLERIPGGTNTWEVSALATCAKP